ncbi:DNA polymerase Y family protein [Hyphomonas sp. WL0036]|nr:DNA polymerase Y family protein [Hyphomonas sediminis]
MDRLRRARRQSRLPSGSAKPAKPRPFVLYEKSAHGLTVAAANQPAQDAGIHPGLRFTDARATLPGLMAAEIDRASDAKALTALADWMVRFSPLVAIDGEDGLILETTGCAHLFGGEAAMAQELSRRLQAAGYGHRLACAGTRGAAYGLAHAAGEDAPPAILPPGGERDALADLPTHALRLSPDALTLLRRFGLTRIGQLYGIDRTALTRRFHSRETADALCLRLDQALGLRAEPFAPFRTPPDYVARLPCPEPLTEATGIAAGVAQLAEKICHTLAAQGLGAQSFTVFAFRADGEVSRIRVNAARPVRTPEHILRLFGEKTEQIDPGFGIDLLLLEAARTGPMETGSHPLSGDLSHTEIDDIALAALADRINARLGEGSVTVISPAAHHPVDVSEETSPFTGTLPVGTPSLAGLRGLRPVRCFARPERVEVIAEVPDGPPLRFVWRRIVRRVVRADGPERIAPEWWTYLPPAPGETGKMPRTRDYYRVEDADGRRYWVFREGLYGDGRGQSPEWFVQGIFA